MTLRGRQLGLERRTGERERGQSLVEFSMIITVVLLLLLGMLEFGFLFDHHLTLEYATREGARVGAALSNGGGTVGCSAGQSPNAATVDQQIIAATQRVIMSPGSAVVASRISEIKIYKSDANGLPTSSNTWVYSATIVAGVPTGNGPSVDGRNLFFISSGASGWPACQRDNGTPDSIGVSLKYDYQLITPLSAAVGFFGPSNGPTTIPIGDHTVMALNPGK